MAGKNNPLSRPDRNRICRINGSATFRDAAARARQGSRCGTSLRSASCLDLRRRHQEQVVRLIAGLAAITIVDIIPSVWYGHTVCSHSPGSDTAAETHGPAPIRRVLEPGGECEIAVALQVQQLARNPVRHIALLLIKVRYGSLVAERPERIGLADAHLYLPVRRHR